MSGNQCRKLEGNKMEFFDGFGWFWMLCVVAIVGFLYQIVLELKGIRKQLEVLIKELFPHKF